MRIHKKRATYVMLIAQNVQQDRRGLYDVESFTRFERAQNGHANLIRVGFWKGTEETEEGLLNEKDRIISWEQGNVLAMNIKVIQHWLAEEEIDTHVQNASIENSLSSLDLVGTI